MGGLYLPGTPMEANLLMNTGSLGMMPFKSLAASAVAVATRAALGGRLDFEGPLRYFTDAHDDAPLIAVHHPHSSPSHWIGPARALQLLHVADVSRDLAVPRRILHAAREATSAVRLALNKVPMAIV